VDITDEVREYLRKPTFDNWQWDDPEMLILLRQMYIDLKLVSNLNIEVKI
jgi:high affinity cGMP-specific 3',5'-cyclic phosphodiesterase 9